jgi:hypothetical protein
MTTTFADSVTAAHQIADHFRRTGHRTASAWATTYSLKDDHGHEWRLTDLPGSSVPTFSRLWLECKARDAFEVFLQI